MSLIVLGLPFVVSTGLLTTAKIGYISSGSHYTTHVSNTTSTVSDPKTSSTAMGASGPCTVTIATLSPDCILKLHGTRIALVNPIFSTTAYGIYGHFYTEGYTVQGASSNTTNPESEISHEVFGSIPLSTLYTGHEENYMTNSTDSIIAYWKLHNFKSHDVIAIYSHDFGKGVVVHTGIFATDIIGSDSQMQFVVLATILTPFP